MRPRAPRVTNPPRAPECAVTHPKLRKPGPRAELVGYKTSYRLDDAVLFRSMFSPPEPTPPPANGLGGNSDVALWGACSCGDLAKARHAVAGGVSPNAVDPTVRPDPRRAGISSSIS